MLGSAGTQLDPSPFFLVREQNAHVSQVLSGFLEVVSYHLQHMPGGAGSDISGRSQARSLQNSGFHPLDTHVQAPALAVSSALSLPPWSSASADAGHHGATRFSFFL